VDDWRRLEDLTLSEFESVASKRVQERVWAYIQGGSGEERTLRANREAFLRRTVRPRALVDVSELDLRTPFLGHTTAAPFFVSPMAYQAEVHPDGEVGVARAARDHGILASYSTLSSNSLEDIATVSRSTPRWFQLYLQPDPLVGERLVQRAEAAEYSAVVLTVDTPVLGVRDRQTIGGFAMDSSVPIGNGGEVLPPARAPAQQGNVYRLRDEASQTWGVIDRLRSHTKLPIVVKGILSAEDARQALAHGAKGILVSNHGGRQLDGAPATLDVLPEVVTAVGKDAEVYVDGGARRGTDILIALALGARGVGIGRPVLWALAVGGADGVRRYFELLKVELATVMALAGVRSVAEIDRDVLRDPG
jgi:4-hydroxymandelate oxidase